MQSDEIARILHVSDFHLFVDAQGNDRDSRLRSALVRTVVGLAEHTCAPERFRELARGFRTHCRQTLKAFLATLRGLVQEGQTGTQIVVQTGDVEAFGWLDDGAFQGFEYWATIRRQLKGASKVIDIYGNHDVWPGTLPAVAPLNAKAVEFLLLQRPEFTALFPDRTVVATAHCFLEFYRVNTVRSGFVENTMAYGRIAADRRILEGAGDVYPGSRGRDPFEELIALAEGDSSRTLPTVRILVMHHPPHFFHASASVKDLAEGPLQNAKDLWPVLSARRFHLVLAGHRHRVDPSPGVRLTPVEHGCPQAPLPNTTVQLVASTATQKVDDLEDERPSFSLYTIAFQRDSETLDVSRTVFRHPNPAYDRFQPGPVELVVSGLPLA